MTGLGIVLRDRVLGDALGEALQADFAVLFRADSEVEARDQLDAHRPTLVLLDAELAGRGPSGLLSRFCTLSAVLVLSEVADHERLVEVLKLGAKGYLSRESGLDDLRTALHGLARGEAAIPPAMLSGLLHELVVSRRVVSGPSENPLSHREHEVLGLLARGLSNADIASELVISPQTARTHIQKVITKLGVHSRSQAVGAAIDRGLIPA